MSAPDLVARDPIVIVKLPEGSAPAWERTATELQRVMEQLQLQLQEKDRQRQEEYNQLQKNDRQRQEETKQMLEESKQMRNSLAKLQRRTNSIALRALLDSVRTKINGDVRLQDAEKLAWNERIANMPAAELTRLGLTANQLGLTKYGINTLQHQGTVAAHDVNTQEIAEAVTSSTYSPEHCALFTFVFNEDPNAYVFLDTV